MATIKPFNGLRYAPEAGDLGTLIAPPYDIISPEQQADLGRRNAHNVIRLELPEAKASDTEAENRYTRAAGLLREWVAGGVLRPEQRPAVYLAQHRFQYAGRSFTRQEVFVRLRLEPWDKRVVLPHEHTLPEPKADRMNLLRATRTNISPVYCLYRDDSGQIQKVLDGQESSAPAASVPQWGTEGFTLWPITDREAIAGLQKALEGQRVYIADGHHRYETALAYRNERDGASPQASPNYVMAALTRLDDPGLLVLPIHRLVRGVSDAQLSALREGLEREWTIERLPSGRWSELERERVPSRFAMYGLEPGQLLVVRPKDEPGLRARVPAQWPEPLRRLDLSLLHNVILHGYLGIGREPSQVEAALGFTQDAGEAIKAVDSESYRLAILVNPTRVEEMVEVAEAGEKMPQKSTFFYPKLPTGLILNPLDD